jgi:hypothetical protein
MYSEEVSRTLKFDDFFYKTYRKGSTEVRVYAAYWAPKRLDPEIVARHTPDVCWVGAGGTIVERDDGRVLPGPGTRVLRPAYFRVFEFPLSTEQVVFWHLLGQVPVQSADQEGKSLIGRLRLFKQSLDLTAFGLRPQEQMFVRISTNGTIGDLVRSDLWPSLVASLAPSGIVGPAR